MAPQSTDPIEVFYSYSHKDEDLRKELEKHLKILERRGVITGWHDRMIGGGEEWKGEIDEHLESADVILLLISPDFISSDYCYDIEMKRAMARHDAGEARVIPIFLRPVNWKGAPFGKLQALPTDARPVTSWTNVDEAFLIVSEGIERAIEELNSKHSPGSTSVTATINLSPYSYIEPPPIVGFVARRDREGRAIVELLKEALAPRRNHLVALWGAGGVGKTALAAEAARSLVNDYEQRVAWISADGRDDFALSMLLDEIATQFGRADLRPLAIEPKKEQVHALIAEAPTLVVLDNFETIKQGEQQNCLEWLAHRSLCSALITTRQRMEFPYARNVPIVTMSSVEAHDFLERLIAQAQYRRTFEGVDRDRIIQTAEANPLILQWVFAQIDFAQDPQEVFDDLAHGEGDAAHRVFDRSYNLPLLNNGGRAALLALSLFVPSASRPALSEVAGLGGDRNKKRFKEAVKNLAALWLVRTTDMGQRLTVEGLTRDLTRAHLSTDLRATTFRQRFVGRFMRFAEAHAKPTAADLNSLEAEKENVLAAMDVAFSVENWEAVIRIRSALREFLAIHGYWDEAISRGKQAETAALAIKDEDSVILAAVSIANIRMRRSEYDEARRTYEQALSTFKQQGSDINIAVVLQNLGQLAQVQGEIEEARRLYNESLEIKKKLGNQRSIAVSLHSLGILAQDEGEVEEARRLYNESLEINRKLGNQGGIAVSLHSTGRLAQDQGEMEEARRLYNESLEIDRKLGDQSGIAISLNNLGSLAQVQGEIEEARRLYNESLEINRKLGNQGDIAASLHQLGTLYLDEKDLQNAEDFLNQSLTILRRLGNKQDIAEALESMGNLKVAQGRLSEARALFDESLEIAQTLGIPFRISSIKYSLGLLAEKENNKAEAVRLFREALSTFEKLGSPKAESTRQALERLEGKSS